jgi:hypothetical protein
MNGALREGIVGVWVMAGPPENGALREGIVGVWVMAGV